MRIISIFLLAFLCWTTAAQAEAVGDAVEVRIVTDNGYTLPTYPVKTDRGIRKVYAEAVKGDHYRIEIRNLLNRRIGLVIAVDGRNIISGSKSWLKNNERMYILEPYGCGQFAGWRTAQDRINRFYFTDVPESYAAAFGDESAMGVIAVAVFPEIRPVEPPIPLSQLYPYDREGKSAGKNEKTQVLPSAPSAAKDYREKKAGRAEQAMESAGTGFGREAYSPSRIVAFEPEKRALETIFLKYEWHSTLCQLGVINCGPPPVRKPNRFWGNEGYAPPPPVSYRGY
ncbi:MAG: hypothetical protein AB1585_08645 [Thermodesulfobacteriota bacterium]